MEPTLEELGYTTFTNERMGKLRRFIFIFGNGYKDRFPICCVLRFSIESALTDGKTIPLSKAQGNKRGSIRRDNDVVFIPCNVFHRKPEDD